MFKSQSLKNIERERKSGSIHQMLFRCGDGDGAQNHFFFVYGANTTVPQSILKHIMLILLFLSWLNDSILGESEAGSTGCF